MFIRLNNPKCPSFRDRYTVSSYSSNFFFSKNIKRQFFKKKIKNNHKFLKKNNSIFIENLNKPLCGMCCIVNVFKVSYSNNFYGFLKFFDGSIVLKKLMFGFKFLNTFYYDFIFLENIKYNEIVNFNKYYIYFFGFDNKFCYLICNKTKKIYSSSSGTFCFFDFMTEEDKLYYGDDYFLVKLPSKKNIFIEYLSTAFFGRFSNIFNKFSRFSSFSSKFLIKKKKQTTRGIAKNPVDHPNGGRSKIKHPFKNPWGFVAKKNK